MKDKTHLYARVSSPKQDTYSQKPELQKWAAQHDGPSELVEDIGTGKDMKRDGISRILDDVKTGSCSRIVVVSINRLGRDAGQVLDVIKLCEKHDVEIISLREKIDTSTPMGRAMIGMVAVLAQLENEQRSEATRAGIAAAKERAAKEGRPWRTGGSKPGWSSKVTRDKAAAILSLKEQGRSYRAIAAAVGLSDKTVRTVCLNPRQMFVTRRELTAYNAATGRE